MQEEELGFCSQHLHTQMCREMVPLADPPIGTLVDQECKNNQFSCLTCQGTSPFLLSVPPTTRLREAISGTICVVLSTCPSMSSLTLKVSQLSNGFLVKLVFFSASGAEIFPHGKGTRRKTQSRSLVPPWPRQTRGLGSIHHHRWVCLEWNLAQDLGENFIQFCSAVSAVPVELALYPVVGRQLQGPL